MKLGFLDKWSSALPSYHLESPGTRSTARNKKSNSTSHLHRTWETPSWRASHSRCYFVQAPWPIAWLGVANLILCWLWCWSLLISPFIPHMQHFLYQVFQRLRKHFEKIVDLNSLYSLCYSFTSSIYIHFEGHFSHVETHKGKRYRSLNYFLSHLSLHHMNPIMQNVILERKEVQVLGDEDVTWQKPGMFLKEQETFVVKKCMIAIIWCRALYLQSTDFSINEWSL